VVAGAYVRKEVAIEMKEDRYGISLNGRVKGFGFNIQHPKKSINLEYIKRGKSGYKT
jgi:hypothetical protein